mmetsp:Transcript_19440/g.48435  ORF Transcript_19440/g.48435 Transcript_19440/m.48435 type:complete len:111 (+) Transcript_19440:4099-4431(+)
MAIEGFMLTSLSPTLSSVKNGDCSAREEDRYRWQCWKNRLPPCRRNSLLEKIACLPVDNNPVVENRNAPVMIIGLIMHSVTAAKSSIRMVEIDNTFFSVSIASNYCKTGS